MKKFRIVIYSAIIGFLAINSCSANAFELFTTNCKNRLKRYNPSISNPPDRTLEPEEIQAELDRVNQDFAKELSVNDWNQKTYGDCYKRSKLFPIIQHNLDALSAAMDEWEKVKKQGENQKKQILSKNSSAKDAIARNNDVLTFKNPTVELNIKAVAIDVPWNRVFLRIGLKNVSNGKIIHPVTTSGNEIKEGYGLQMIGEHHTIVAVPSGIEVTDSFNNKYELEYILPEMDGSKQVMPQESINLDIRVNGKLVEQVITSKSSFLQMSQTLDMQKLKYL